MNGNNSNIVLNEKPNMDQKNDKEDGVFYGTASSVQRTQSSQNNNSRSKKAGSRRNRQITQNQLRDIDEMDDGDAFGE